ncbi:hypothetical protein [Nocardia sp. NPDC003726]
MGAPTKVLASNIPSPAAVALRAGSGKAYVLCRTSPAQLYRVDLSTGTATPMITHLGEGCDIAWTNTIGSQLAVADRAGQVLLVDVTAPGGAPQVFAQGMEPIWGVDLAPGGGALLLGSGSRLLRLDLPSAPKVQLDLPAEPMYLSSWARVGVTTAGVAFEDLAFRVDPPEGGLVSHSKDATFPIQPSVVLATGGQTGSFRLIAHDRNTGEELAVGHFEITDTWSDADGPPASFVGEFQTDTPAPEWGGGDPFHPQNLSVRPVLGTYRVAIVIAETSDNPALSNAGQAALRSLWEDEVFNGVARGGVLESARGYWRDVSDSQIDLVNAGVVGPVRLANNWASYATQVNTTTGQTDGWEGFARAVVAELRSRNEALAGAGQPPLVDLMTVDSIILVVRSIPASSTNPGRHVWPSATRPGGYQLTFEVAQRSLGGVFPIRVPVPRTIQMFAIADDSPTWGQRERGESAAHELGHNFCLPDENAVASHADWAKRRDLARQIWTGATSSITPGDSWSLMAYNREFPQPVLVERMMLGWVKENHIRSLNFATVGPVDETVTLCASDLGTPPANQFSGVEVRIADGQNWYFEYRRQRPTAPADQDIPADRTVVGTECWSGEAPVDRRNILRVEDDSDVDRGEFQLNDDYEVADVSNAAYPNDFKMTVVETTADHAKIHIKYGDAKPDPQIRPWAQSTNWKSPDLRIINARNQVDNRYADMPWEGHDNRIVATVRNPGQMNAKAVRVDFYVKDFTVGGGKETHYGGETRDVNTGAEVTFTSTVPWIPPWLSLLAIRPHYCVIARIAEYKDPADPTIREIAISNNEAQSNYTQLMSVSASPSTREMGFVKVTNPSSLPADCRVAVSQTSPLARTYIEKAWVRLQPGEERDVLFMTESVLGDPVLKPLVDEIGEGFAYDVPNSLRLTGIVDDHQSCDGQVTGGAHVLVRAARGTRFVDFGYDDGVVWGRIETVDDNTGANGTVLVTITAPEGPPREEVREATLDSGFFRIQVGDVPYHHLLRGHYLGAFDLAPCESWPITVE